MIYEITSFPAREATPPKILKETPTIHASSIVRNCKLGSWTDIGAGCTLVEANVAEHTYLAGDSQLIYADIGKFCSIASFVRINPGNHPMDRATQHHMTYRRIEYGLDTQDDHEFFEWRRDHRCQVGHDVWIGHNATIMPGVVIGNGAVIGTGSVVTKNVEPYSVVAGVPAKKIRNRFDDATITRIADSKWWDWDRATLVARWKDLMDPKLL